MHPFDEYDEELRKKALAEIAAEDAKYAALSDEEKKRISEEREAKLAGMLDIQDEDEDEDEDEEEQP
jgi:hypothetical protein